MSRKKISSKFVTALVGSFLLLGFQANSASARSQHASSGSPAGSGSGLGPLMFQAHPSGVIHTVADPWGWTMPLILDTAGEKHIHVKARVLSGSGLQCRAQSFSGAGAFLGQSALVTFAATGVFTSQELVLSAAAAPLGAQVAVTCGFSGTGVTLLGLEY